MSSNESKFSSLPYEIFQHILSFGVDCELKNPSIRNSDIRMVAKFQSLNKKISSLKEMQDYFNRFWWNVLEKNLEIGQIFASDLEKLRLEMTKRDEMKRKILLASYINFKVYQRPKYDSNSQKYQQDLKIIVLGQVGVGKSSITIYFAHKIHMEYDPTLQDLFRKRFKVDEEPVYVNILDTAEYQEYSAMRDQYMAIGDAFVIVCSASDESSVTGMRGQVQYLILSKVVEVNVMPVVFVMNKMDLLDSTNREKIIDRFKQEVHSIVSDFSLLNYSIMECSAKNGENIDEIFEECVRKQILTGGIDNLNLLKGCIEQDTLYIEECKKKAPTNKKNNCSIM